MQKFNRRIIFLMVFFVSAFFAEKSYSSLFIDEAQNIKPLIGKPVVYDVRKGESLYEIARKFQTTMSHIRRANNLLASSRNAKLAKKLIIPRFRILPDVIQNGIVLNLPELMLYLFKDGKCIAYYPVTAGRLSMRTPIGNFKIISKVLHPTWSPPEWAGIDHPVPPGPHNPLGDRWLGLNAEGVGIHSTNAPSSIGNFVSHGCVRMYPWHAEKLFNQVSVGMPVNIIYKPVKIGIYKGRLYMEVYPDTYGRGKLSLASVLSLLDKFQIRGAVDEKRIAKIYASAKGIPEPIFGEDVKVVAGGESVNFEWPVLLKDGAYYVHLQELAALLGLDVVWDEEQQLLHVGKNGKDISYELSTGMIYLDQKPLGQGQYLLQVRDELYVPLKFTLRALSLPFQYDVKKKIATISP